MFPKHVCSELEIQLFHAFCICCFHFPTLNLGVLCLEIILADAQVLRSSFLAFFFLTADSLITSKRHKCKHLNVQQRTAELPLFCTFWFY